jgi:hypothetical protein
MNMEMTTKNIAISIISLIYLFFLLPQNTFANRVEHPSETISIVCVIACDDTNNTLRIPSISGQIYASAKTQKFDMVRSDNSKNLTDGAEIPIGTKLKYTNYDKEPANGTWNFTGGTYDSPDMNEQWYQLDFKANETYEECICEQYKCIEENKQGECKKRSTTDCKKEKCTTKTNDKTKQAQIKVSPPSNNKPDKIEGRGAVVCDNDKRECTTTSTGDASITITFPKATATIKGRLKDDDDDREDTSEFKFDKVSFTYDFTVYDPNTPPIVSNCGASNVNYEDGRITWNYSDADGDRQAKAYVQVSTASDFSQFNYGVNKVINSNATTLDVNGLIPGTRYYFRVKANDGKVDGGWCNTASFNTPSNNPPNLDRLSCSATSGATDYTRANINWNYTGTDEPGDVLVFKLRYKKTTESVWNTIALPGNQTGVRNIANLISGYEYDIQVSLNDNRNSNLGDRWKGCGRFTTTEYPEPSVDFNLKSGSTTVAKGETLTIKTGDPISTNWKITNTDGLNPSSCALSTEGVRTIFNESGLGFGPDSRQNNNVEPDKADQTYTINLSCTGKEAKVPRSVNANITLVIQSYPLISCRVVNTKVVTAERPTAEVEGTIGNANPQYTWRIKRTIGENYGSPITSDSTTQKFTLDYTGLGLGKYNPVIEAKGSLGRTAKKTCPGDITNFGDRSIREVAK